MLAWLSIYVALGSERHEIRWFFAWYVCVPVLAAALVALFFQNLWAFAGGSRLESGVAAWVSSIIGFVTRPTWLCAVSSVVVEFHVPHHGLTRQSATGTDRNPRKRTRPPRVGVPARR